MLRVLSIDFDYFIDVNEEQREEMFPQLPEEDDKEIIAKEWEDKYEKYPKIKDIGVIKDLELIKAYLKYNSKDSIFHVANSHKQIYPILEGIPKKENIGIVNVDFHHDYYHHFIGGAKYNCGNWLRVIKQKRPNTKITWVGREDSQTVSLEGEFPYTFSTEISTVFKHKYDIIFLCFSPEWTPPHLEEEYLDLILTIQGEVGETSDK